MQRSDSIATLAPALVRAQFNIGSATKGSENPFFKSSYADLGTVMAACKDALLDEDITILQMVGRDETGDYLETIILHGSGEFISDRMRLICSKQHDPQSMGSAITYARRYALQSALFIPAVDDDGEKAMAGIRDDERITHRQHEREAATSFAPKGVTHLFHDEGDKISDPSDIDKINEELALSSKPKKYGHTRKNEGKSV